MKTVQLKITLPADVKAWLELEAKKNIRSQGAEIFASLRDRMKRGDGFRARVSVDPAQSTMFDQDI